MSALTNLLNRYNEGDAVNNLEMLVIISRDEVAAEELARLQRLDMTSAELLESAMKGDE